MPGAEKNVPSWRRSCSRFRREYKPQVEMLQLLKAAELSGKLLDLIVEHVENFQVLQFGDVRRHH